jgi:hypothetical protein
MSGAETAELFANIPEELKNLDQWVNWAGIWSEDKAKFGKAPMNASNGRNGSSTNEDKWTTFDKSVAALGRPGVYTDNAGKKHDVTLDGIGFAGLGRTPYTGIDLDHCLDPETGEINPAARKIIDDLDSYAEITPSGCGVRVWVEAEKPPESGCANKNGETEIEVYTKGRFFTVTGRHLEGTPRTIEKRQDALDAFMERHAPPGEAKPPKAEYNGDGEDRLDLPGWLPEYGVTIHKQINDASSERAYSIVCPWAHEHTGGDTSGTRVGQYPSGALWFKCEHGHCDGRKWEHFRELLDPEAYRKASINTGGRKIYEESPNGRGDANTANTPNEPEKQKMLIKTNNRHLRDVTADTLEALETSNNPPEMFVRAGALVRVREDEHGTPQIQNMDLNHVRGRADRCADFVRITKQGDNWIKTRVNPPEIVVKDLMALPTWPFPALEAVVESPILRPDGSVFDTPGYDAKSRLYYRPVPGFRHPEIPADPSKGEVRAALELVNEAIGEFPYADKSSAANTLGLLVTLLIRQAIPGPVPLALIDAPQAGTGKTLLAEIVAMIGTGRAGEMLGAPRDDEEWRKQITSKLSAGGTLIVVDNVENALYAPSLARALTSRTWTDRVLGRSEMVTVSQQATWIATGNNISLRGDLPRRCYWIRLDAKDSRPWKREKFKHPDLTSWVEKSRGELVGAVLTIARGWYAAGKPKAKGVPRLGSFEAWAEIVGGILAFARIEGFLGNLEELYSKADEGNAEWEAFLEEWWRQRGENPIAVKDLAKLIEDKKLLRDALPGDLSEARDKGEGSFTRRLGKAIAKRAGTRYGDDGLHITEAGEVRRAKLWRVRDSSGGCEFVSFVSLYNPSASKNGDHHTREGAEKNSPNSQTHTPNGSDAPEDANPKPEVHPKGDRLAEAPETLAAYPDAADWGTV